MGAQDEDGAALGDGPVGQGPYVVAAGECLASIADAHGHFWQHLWEHPDNAALRRARRDPNILLAGDRVTIPPIQPKDEPCTTGKRHVFRRRGVPEVIKLVLRDDAGAPLAGKRYELTLGDAKHTGRTGPDGLIHHHVPTGVIRGSLRVWLETPGKPEVSRWSLAVGHLDPADTTSGVKARLNNLGFPCGAPDGSLDDRTRHALSAFQEAQGLPVTGEPDQATWSTLADVHDRAAG